MVSAVKGIDCTVGGAPHVEIQTQGDWTMYLHTYQPLFYSEILEELTGTNIFEEKYIKYLHMQRFFVILFEDVYSGLSIRGRGQGLPPAAMNVSPGYFHRKIEEKLPSRFIPGLLVFIYLAT